eukprot:1140523-Pelagomonas_calceolata.AAC.5
MSLSEWFACCDDRHWPSIFKGLTDLLFSTFFVQQYILGPRLTCASKALASGRNVPNRMVCWLSRRAGGFRCLQMGHELNYDLEGGASRRIEQDKRKKSASQAGRLHSGKLAS